MKISLRIPYFCYYQDEMFEKHLQFLKPYLNVVDEIAMFVEYSHRGYWPLEGQKALAEVLKARVDAYRAAGIKSVGLNILDTIGHLDEAWDLLEEPPMQTMVGPTGQVSLSCLCPNTEEFRRYTAERYAILLQAKPDFVWIDDDFRITNHGPAGPCYCPGCIAKYNAAYQRSETFESLTAAVREDPNGTVAREWDLFWVDSMTDLATFIRETAHAILPELKFGKMTGYKESHREWNEAFGAVKGRPGGGFYYDSIPREMMLKMLQCEAQMTEYPDFMTDRQYEYENFPYMELAKSKTIMDLELRFALMSGCNGVALNASGHYDSALMKNTLDILAKKRQIFGELANRTAVCSNQGVYCPQIQPIGFQLMELGIPVTGDPKGACATMLTGDTAQQYTDEELLNLLKGNLFLDNQALDYLTQRGFDAYCGVKSGKYYDNGVLEVFTDHPVNGDYAGFVRNGWMNFGGIRIPVAALEPLDDQVQVLADLKTLHMDPLGPCMTLYRNSLGGNVAVSTYMFSHYWQFTAKQQQFKNLFDAMVPGGAPVKVNAAAKVVPVLRQNEQGQTVLLIANMSFDFVEPFTVDVKAEGLAQVLEFGDNFKYPCEKIGDRYRLYLRGLNPWESFVLVNG